MTYNWVVFQFLKVSSRSCKWKIPANKWIQIKLEQNKEIIIKENSKTLHFTSWIYCLLLYILEKTFKTEKLYCHLCRKIFFTEKGFFEVLERYDIHSPVLKWAKRILNGDIDQWKYLSSITNQISENRTMSCINFQFF